jgi:hypothetical protein
MAKHIWKKFNSSIIGVVDVSGAINEKKLILNYNFLLGNNVQN